MGRVRISTTVDEQRLEELRRRLALKDSELLDRALLALLEQIETEVELTALEQHPYEDDPDLAWEAPPGPDLPYDGGIPRDVVELAARRRRSH